MYINATTKRVCTAGQGFLTHFLEILCVFQVAPLSQVVEQRAGGGAEQPGPGPAHPAAPHHSCKRRRHVRRR